MEPLQQQTTQGTQAYNSPYTTESALNMRLNTAEPLQRIQEFLEGKQRLNFQKEDGTWEVKDIPCGEPKANNLGVQGLLSRLTALFNASVVQGNYKDYMYFDHICQMRKELTDEIVINCNKWNVDESDLSGVVDMIMGTLKCFLSRLIDNKERESYTNTIRTVEQSSLQGQSPQLFKT